MNRIISSAIAGALAMVCFTACYDDFVEDYNYTAMYFSSQKPLRTVISDRDMSIKVGVAMGGMREVDKNAWAEFEVAPELLDGTEFSMLPSEYYTFSDNSVMRVSNAAVPIADVTISFTDAFFNDNLAVEPHYAIPFRVVSASVDSLLNEKTTSIVAIKFVNSWQGTYYVKGSVNEVGSDDNSEVYSKSDLSKNISRTVNTVSRYESIRQGVANSTAAGEAVKLQFHEDGTVGVTAGGDAIKIIDGNGTWEDSGERMLIKLQYVYEKSGTRYSVSEELYRRQDPLKDLVFEEW